MLTRQRTTKAGARLLAVLAAFSFALPTGAFAADVTNCTPGGATAPNPADDCPEFSPDFMPTIEKPWTGSISSITQRWDQQAGESNPVNVELGFPRNWLFSVASVDDSGVWSALNSDTQNCSAARIANAEAISAVGGLILKSKSGATTSYSGSASRTLFMHWDSVAKSALLCVQFGSSSSPAYSLPAHLDQVDGDPVYGWKLSIGLDPIARDPNNVGTSLTTNKTITYFTVGISGVSAGNWNRDAANALSPVIFSRAPFDGETTAMSADWQACRNGVRPVGATYSPPALGQTSCNGDVFVDVHAERPLTIMLPPTQTYALDFGRLTGPTRIAGTNGGVGQSNPIPVGGYSLIRGTNVAKVTWNQPGAPVGGVRQYGPDATIRGYVLVAAESGVQESRHFERFVTQQFEVDQNNSVTATPAAGFDPAGPCGADGTGNACTFDLRFPLMGIGGKVLSGNGKYDIALVTIYSDGFRTDGRCDDGTGIGAVCDPARAGHNVVNPGISAWQFVMRTETYANAYLEYYIAGGTKSGPCFSDLPASSFPGNAPNQGGFGNSIDGCIGGNKSVQPRFILLVDYASKKADFIVWGNTTATALNSNLPFVWGFTQVGNAQNGAAQDFAGSNSLINGRDDTGTVTFGNNFKPDGSAPTWRFDGITNLTAINQGGSTLAGTPCFSVFLFPGQPFGGTKAACGVFTLMRPNNWTVGPLNTSDPLGRTCVGITSPTCQPNLIEEVFEGIKI